jgi:hypothetical protein
VPYWSHLVNGAGKPVIGKVCIEVSAGPGLAIAWSEEARQKYLGDGGWFEPAGSGVKETRGVPIE